MEDNKMEQKESGKEIKLPITGAIQCPNCSSTESIGRAYLEQLEKAGKIPKGMAAKGMAVQFPVTAVLMSPLVASLTEIPVINIGFEVCAQCFTIYSPGVFETKQPVKVEMQRMTPPGFTNPGQNRFERRHP